MLRHTKLLKISRRRVVAQSNLSVQFQIRCYTQSNLLGKPKAKIDPKALRELESRRNSYAKQVSVLRKQYADEVARQLATEQAAAEAEKRETTRRHLEHARRKNMKSAKNALRQQQLKEKRDAEFAEEIRIKRQERDAKHARFAKARQMIVNELEQVAHLWLTTPQEVEDAFTWEAEQLLWARPNSVIGEENPSLDTAYWSYETHTWHMDKTYPIPRELLLKELLEEAYEEANVDAGFWTPERVAEREALERKARLRAMVRDTGRRILLKKQRELLQDRFSNTDKTQIPNPMPVPSLRVLANTEAQEEEGAKILLKDPTMFFEFDSSEPSDSNDEDDSDGDITTYRGPTLGAPVALKDPTAYGPHENRPYPQPVGKLLKPDTRSERQKKRDERQQRMWEAAQEKLSDEEQLVSQVEAAAEKKFGGATIDYNNPPDYDSDDEEWLKGLDSEIDSNIINTPRDKRYKEEDILWVKAELEKKSGEEKKLLRSGLANVMHEPRSKKESEVIKRDLTSEPEEFQREEDEDAELRSLGVDVDQVNSVLESLSQEQVLSLLSMDDMDTDSLSQDEITEALMSVPGLTEEQVQKIVHLEKSLAGNPKVRAAFGKNDANVKEDC